MSVHATLSLRIGPELFAEPWDDDTLARARVQAESLGAFDGGLWLGHGDEVACRPDLWDQLDGLLASWLRATTSLVAGAASADVQFPDTRIEVELLRSGPQVSLAYEDLAATLTLADLHTALRAAGERLLAATSDVDLANLHALSAAVTAAQEPTP